MKYKLKNYYQNGGIKELSKHGLINLGNTCYFNAGILLLYHCKELKNFLIIIQEQYKNDTLAYNIIEILKFLDKNNSNNKFDDTNLRNLVDSIINKCNFNIGEQQDSQELLEKVLNQLQIDCLGNLDFLNIINDDKKKICNNNEILMRFKKNDPIDWYKIKLIEEYKYNDEVFLKKITPYNFNQIKFANENDIKLKMNIQQIIDLGEEPEYIPTHKFEYKGIQKVGSTKYIDFEYSKYIFINPIIKIFDFENIDDNDNILYKKLLYNYTNINKELKIKDKEYELVGFIEHQGGVSGGHYVCYIYNNNQYILYDDNIVKYNAKPLDEASIPIILYRLKNTNYNTIDTTNKYIMNYLEPIEKINPPNIELINIESKTYTIFNLICKNL